MFCFVFLSLPAFWTSGLCVGWEKRKVGLPFFEKSIPTLVPQSLTEMINFIIIEKEHGGEEREEAVDITGDAGNHSDLNLTEWLNVSAFISKAHTQDFMVSCTLWSKSTWTVKGGAHSESIYRAGILLSFIYLRELSLTSSAPTKTPLAIKSTWALPRLHFLQANLLTSVST